MSSDKMRKLMKLVESNLVPVQAAPVGSSFSVEACYEGGYDPDRDSTAEEIMGGSPEGSGMGDGLRDMCWTVDDEATAKECVAELITAGFDATYWADDDELQEDQEDPFAKDVSRILKRDFNIDMDDAMREEAKRWQAAGASPMQAASLIRSEPGKLREDEEALTFDHLHQAGGVSKEEILRRARKLMADAKQHFGPNDDTTLQQAVDSIIDAAIEHAQGSLNEMDTFEDPNPSSDPDQQRRREKHKEVWHHWPDPKRIFSQEDEDGFDYHIGNERDAQMRDHWNESINESECEHEWEEVDAEPPYDVCVSCGERRD